jgi:hypothetical protein
LAANSSALSFVILLLRCTIIGQFLKKLNTVHTKHTKVNTKNTKI